ncbi:MAG: dihydrolipoyllysine-residue acetyltransferase [Acidobacteria bacterium]|nr:dihydrolipoyllysine-residue acetyltransferase [Acidobacteriota bacterium]
MADLEQILIPDIGDEPADVVEVLVSPGDVVAVEDSLITLESDKASMEVPSPAAGKVHDVKVKVGDRISQGDLILTLEPSAASTPAEPSVEETSAPEVEEQEPASPELPVSSPPPATAAVAPPPHIEEDFTNVYASPAVRRFARELGVDLTRVKGTGRKARILKEDVQAFVKQELAAPSGGGAVLPAMPVIDFSKFGAIERRKLTRIQKIAGPNLQRSWLNAPHVTQNDWADITEMETFRQAHSEEAEARGIKLTPLAFLMKASVAALQEFPTVNSSLDPDGDALVLKRYYHLGIAVDTEDGLMVPVIRDVDQKSLFQLAEELGVVSAATRERKLKPDQLRGASFTISSLGGIGGAHFSPIVNTPEVAILGVARARWRPVWSGSEFEPRLMLPFSLSYDHRVVDGALGVRFTTYLGRVLTDLRRLLL